MRNGHTDSPRTVQQSVLLTGEVGLSERFSLTGLAPLRRTALSGPGAFETTGTGDLLLDARQSLTDPEKNGRFTAVAIYGAWLPTGKANSSRDIAENVSFTRGAVTLDVGGEVAWRAGRSRIFGQIDAQYPLGDDRNGYHFAASRTGAVTLSHPLAGDSLSWLLGAQWRYTGVDELKGVSMVTRGGSSSRASGGILWSVRRRQNVGLLVSRLIRADMNGDRATGEGQLVARNEFVVAWQGTFGTHRHPVD
ncbi:MAG: transporter [Acidobacteria bacterium]|nr:transporter [Acidobacteriota bacterium]